VTNNGTKSAAKRGWGFDRAIVRACRSSSCRDAEAAACGRFDRSLTREDLHRAFFLDDADRELIGKRRQAPNRLGFALQLTTARWLGTFLPYPTDVPPVVRRAGSRLLPTYWGECSLCSPAVVNVAPLLVIAVVDM
jgi:hypothetical protein